MRSSGSIAVKLIWPSTSKSTTKSETFAPAGVSTIRLIITGSGVTPELKKVCSVSADFYTVDSVPVGVGRTVTAEALDTAGVISHKGTIANVLVAAGLTTNAESLTMNTTPSPTSLSKTRTKLKNGDDVVIICIGSSSTAGAGASSPYYSYPSQLSRKLKSAFTSSNITVLNRGVGGEVAQQSYDRFPTDVFIAYPDLVIWQAGTNDVGNVELSTFIQTLQSGSCSLLSRGYEIMLLEPQYYPGVGESPQYIAFVQAMQSVASQLYVEVIPRYDLIKNQVLSGKMDVLSADQFHLSDKGYGIVVDYIFNILNK